MKRQLKMVINQMQKNGPTASTGKRGKRKRQCFAKDINEAHQCKQKNHAKHRYIPPVIKQKKTFSLPQENEFTKEVLEYLKTSKEKSQIISKHDLKHIFAIFKEVDKKGGIIEVLSVGEFASIAKEVLSGPTIDSKEAEKILSLNCLTILQQLFFTFEYMRRNPEQKKKIYSLGMVTFVQKQQLKNAMSNLQTGLSYFNHDLTIFQQGAQAMGFTHEIFNLTSMCQYYGSQSIDIRIQNPCDYGFNVKRLKNKAYEMTLGEYRFYQLNFHDPTEMAKFKHVDQLGKGQVFFGVNFEPHDQMLNKEVKKITDKTFLDFYGEFDMLSYLDADVPGCSIPQMYFKVPGCWTGGHQENISMSALNINHGPGYSEWFTLDLKYIEKLRAELKESYKMDLYEQEGLWYEDLDWFISHGYPVKRFLQRKNDIVVTGPGTLHWVRSFGLALQTSWNMMPKSLDQFEAAYHRQEENEKIKFQKGNVIPLKAITLKYLNHQRKTMRKQIRELCYKKIKQWQEGERQILLENSPEVQLCILKNISDLYSFCEACLQEVYLFYVTAPKQCQGGILCLKCHFSDEYDIKDPLKIKKLFYKYDQFSLQTLYNRLENIEYDQGEQILELCSGQHVGRVPCARNNEMVDQKPSMRQNDYMIAERSLFYNNEELFEICQKAKADQQDKKSIPKTFSIEKPKPEILEVCCQTEENIKMIDISTMVNQEVQCHLYEEVSKKQYERGSSEQNGKRRRNQNHQNSRNDWKQYTKHDNEGKQRRKQYCTGEKKWNNDDHQEQGNNRRKNFNDRGDFRGRGRENGGYDKNKQFKNFRRNNEERNERKTSRSDVDNSHNNDHNPNNRNWTQYAEKKKQEVQENKVPVQEDFDY